MRQLLSMVFMQVLIMNERIVISVQIGGYTYIFIYASNNKKNTPTSGSLTTFPKNPQIFQISKGSFLPPSYYSIEVRPGITLAAKYSQHYLIKMQEAMIADECLSTSRIKMEDLLEKWQRRIMEIEENIRNKCGVDVNDVEGMNQTQGHTCKFCDKTFTKAQALGGHVSKMHPSSNGGLPKKTHQINKSAHSKAVKKTVNKINPQVSTSNNLFGVTLNL